LKVVAIVPAHLVQTDELSQEPLDVIPVLTWWVRGALLIVVGFLVAVFSVAWWLKPFDEEGSIRETYPELMLPTCTFKYVTGLPCPSCGMTHSFVFLIHGDFWSSVRSNAVGTGLAIFCLMVIPWALICVIRGQPTFIVSIELALTKVIVVFLVTMMLRWGIVLAWTWWSSNG
jgi:hypothetical protein